MVLMTLNGTGMTKRCLLKSSTRHSGGVWSSDYGWLCLHVSGDVRLCGDVWFFQSYFQGNMPHHLRHPPGSLDLNSNENVWGWMVKDVHPYDWKFTTINEHCNAIFSKPSWKPIFSSISQRIFEVINKNGVENQLKHW